MTLGSGGIAHHRLFLQFQTETFRSQLVAVTSVTLFIMSIGYLFYVLILRSYVKMQHTLNVHVHVYAYIAHLTVLELLL